MLAYAILVTFCFGLLMGSCATVIAALRMEKCCPFCTGPLGEFVETRKVLTENDQAAANDILNYDRA